MTVYAQDRLWYDSPARIWLQALPLGNSHMGAMVYGGTAREETKELLAELNRRYHGIKDRIVGALQRGHIDGW